MARTYPSPILIAVLGLLFFFTHVPAATQSKRVPMVPKWTRFEQSFRSSVNYPNALQDATVSVVFTSPLGETNVVYGFWDGGKVWRVRFSPDQPGLWTYATTCSDVANRGLHNKRGSLLCTAAVRGNRFGSHGPVRVARDNRYFEHADGTPFFWMADTVWEGARLAEPKDWETYVGVRRGQNFTVAQWAAASGRDFRKQTPFTGQERILINPEFFQRLDVKLDTLASAGLLSAITPFGHEGFKASAVANLPDDQIALLLRYLVARWGAYPVAWLMTLDPQNRARSLSWQRSGEALFGGGQPTLVVLWVGRDPGMMDEFRDQPWVGAFAYDSSVHLLRDRENQSAFSQQQNKRPLRPLIGFLPLDNSVEREPGKRITADEIRKAAYSSVFAAPCAGISYGTKGIANWEPSPYVPNETIFVKNASDWPKELVVPSAHQMAGLRNLIDGVEFRRLRPASGLVAAPPEGEGKFVAAGTEAKDFAFVYVPDERNVELNLDAMPVSPVVTWLNPRNGESSPAVAVVGGATCQLPTPGPGDWLLVLKRGF